MEADPESYDDVVAAYLQMIKQDSPEAAAAIEEIRARFGSKAALRATLVITLVQIAVRENRPINDIANHTDLIKDYPEVLPLVEHAVRHYLLTWSIVVEKRVTPDRTSADGDAPSSTSESPTV